MEHNYEELLNNKNIIVIYDTHILNDDQINILTTHARDNNINILSNNIGYGIKVIETCYEIFNNETNKIDNNVFKKPLIISNESQYLSTENNSQIKSVNDIMIEIMGFKSINLSDNLQLIFITSDETSQLKDGILYLTIDDFLSINKIENNNIDKSKLENLSCEKISLYSILPTFVKIMSNSLKYNVDECDNIVCLKYKNHIINILKLSDFNVIHEYDFTSFDIVIVDNLFNFSKDVSSNPSLLYIYNIIKQPNLYFKK